MYFVRLYPSLTSFMFFHQLNLIFVYFCYPEVSGLSLEEVQVIFKYGFGIKKSEEIRRLHEENRDEERQREEVVPL